MSVSRTAILAATRSAWAALALFAGSPASPASPASSASPVPTPATRQGAEAAAGALSPVRAPGGSGSLVASGATGAASIALLDCASGRVLGQVRTPHPLAAPVVADFARGALYAATRGADLLRYSIPELTPQARQPLAFEPTALAVSHGPDALVLAGGRGQAPVSAHDPRTLEPLMRYPASAPSQVAAILDVAARGRFLVAFADLPELWEIAYDRDAPAVLRGLVHDYRMGEAVALPGRLTPRPFAVPSATRELIAGATAFEVLRVDVDGVPGVVNLDVRREIERPRLDARPGARMTTDWSLGSRRGWLIATTGSAARLLEAPDWRVVTIELGGTARALGHGSDRGRPLVVIEAATGTALLRIDATHARVQDRTGLPAAAATADRIVAGSDGQCAALLDREGRWLGSFANAP